MDNLSTRQGQRTWLRVGLALVVAGILLWVGAYVYQGSLVIAHHTLTIHAGDMELGTYQLGDGDYTIWIGDHCPGFDEGERFHVGVSGERGAFEYGEPPDEYRTRTLAGIECEEAGTFYFLEGGELTFTVGTVQDTSTGEDVHVFITRADSPGPALMFAAGTLCLSLGLITMGLVVWAKRKEMAEEG